MGDILIHPTLKVGELSLESILTDPAQTYLIGNKDKSSILCRKTVELILGYVEHSIYILPISRKKEIRQPKSHTVDKYHTPTNIMTT